MLDKQALRTMSPTSMSVSYNAMLAITQSRCYSSLAAEKIAAGCGSLFDRCDYKPQLVSSLAALSFRAPSMAARLGIRKGCRFAPAVAGLPPHSGCRPYVEVRTAVFKTDRLEFAMSTITSVVNPSSVFSFENHEIRSVIISDEPWFIAADVCKAIGIQNPTQAIANLDEDERAMFNIGRQGETNIVSESGLYTLILRCRDAVKPGTLSHRFRKFTTSVMLPAIRKTGKYESSPVQQALPFPSSETGRWTLVFKDGVPTLQPMPEITAEKVLELINDQNVVPDAMLALVVGTATGRIFAMASLNQSRAEQEARLKLPRQS